MALVRDHIVQEIPILRNQWKAIFEICPTGILPVVSSVFRVGLGGDKEKDGDRCPD